MNRGFDGRFQKISLTGHYENYRIEESRPLMYTQLTDSIGISRVRLFQSTHH